MMRTGDTGATLAEVNGHPRLYSVDMTIATNVGPLVPKESLP